MLTTKLITTVIVSLLALGTVVATSASAAVSWKIAKAELGAGATRTIESPANVTQAFDFESEGLTIKCSGFASTKFSVEGLVAISANVLQFKGCEVATGECKLEGNIIETPAKIELIGTAKKETAPKDSVAISPKTGPKLFEAITLTGPNCAFKGPQPITGKLTLLMPAGQNENTEQEFTANTTPGEIKIGSSAATLTGKMKLKLVPEPNVDEWSFS